MSFSPRSRAPSTRQSVSRPWLRFAGIATIAALAIPFAASARINPDSGFVYTMTNATSGNRILAFIRDDDGRLTQQRGYPTGGTGTGGGLGNAGAIALSGDGSLLFAVNPGSDSVTMFARYGNFLLRRTTVSSGGSRPVSLSYKDGVLYVLNAGTDSLQGFRLGLTGQLRPIENSQRLLTGTGTMPAQVGFNRAGDLLAVTEKATGKVLTFAVDGEGLLGEPTVRESATPTPFGFTFSRRDQLLVSEANGGAAGGSGISSYQIAGNGSSQTITASLRDTQSAACWVESTCDGRFAYVANTGSDNLSLLSVSPTGTLNLTTAVAADTGAGSKPTDLALDPAQKYLYTLNPGTGTIAAFSIAANGALTLLETQPSSDITAAATGLVAR